MATTPRFDPFAELAALQKQLFGQDFLSPFTSNKTPTTDVYTQDDKQLVVEAHLPGFSEENVSIEIEDGTLVIQAEKQEKEESNGKKYVVRESSNAFYRRVHLPERADQNKVEAYFKDGLLTVVVPFIEPPSAQKITIKPGGAPQQATGQADSVAGTVTNGSTQEQTSNETGAQSSPSNTGTDTQ